ncbi:MAG: PAS domain-containing protein [Maricaulaceae bacterium]
MRTETTQRFLDTLMETSNDAVVFFDADAPYTVRRVNPAFMALTGYGAQDCEGQPVRLFRADAGDRTPEARLRQAMAAGGAASAVGFADRKDGADLVQRVDIAPVMGEGDAPTHYIAIFRPLDPRRAPPTRLDFALAALDQVADELAHAEARNRALGAAFPGLALAFDLDLRPITAEGSGLGDFGLTPRRLAAATLAELFPTIVFAAAEPQLRAALTGERRAFELAFAGRRYDVIASPARTDLGVIVGGVAAFRDVTDERLALESAGVDALASRSSSSARRSRGGDFA